MSYAAARLNMLDTQVRVNDVTDARIQAAMGAIPRERFVPSARAALAYADVPVQIAPQRYLLDPRSFAKLLQLARIEPDDSVLDVGCGTGYSSAVIAHMAKSVVALEQDADLVGLLYKPTSGEDDDGATGEENDAQPVNLLIAKQRNGPTGDVNLTFLKSFTRFESAAKVSDDDVPV